MGLRVQCGELIVVLTVRATSRAQEMQADPLVTPTAGFIALQKRRKAYPEATEDGREPVSALQRVRELLSVL
jgi:hypothetical protein